MREQPLDRTDAPRRNPTAKEIAETSSVRQNVLRHEQNKGGFIGKLTLSGSDNQRYKKHER